MNGEWKPIRRSWIRYPGNGWRLLVFGESPRVKWEVAPPLADGYGEPVACGVCTLVHTAKRAAERAFKRREKGAGA